ncbi:MAG TPA: hypothetical protein VOA19_19445, partial [Actinomycetes bacterium]|nr:hypothetical protein [Actinomycetes bacterium]
DVFAAEGVDTAFVNTFARYDLPHHGDPDQDLDMASYGVVKVFRERLGHRYPTWPGSPRPPSPPSPTGTGADRVRSPDA